MPALELVPSELPQIRWQGPEGSKFRFFFFMSTSDIRRHQEKKTKFVAFRSTPSYLRWSGRQQFASVRRLSIRESFDGPQTPVLKLSPSRSSQIRWRGQEGSEFRVFFSWHRRQMLNQPFFSFTSASDVKKLNLPPSVPLHRICGNPEVRILMPASVLHQ